MSVLVVTEHDRGELASATLEALTAARTIATKLAVPLEALSISAQADDHIAELAHYGVTLVHQVHHDMLTDYGPEMWGEIVAQATRTLSPRVVLAGGTSRGNEVIAQAAARLDLAMLANCTEVTIGTTTQVVRTRWGGSLLEDAELTANIVLLTIAHHALEATPADTPATCAISSLAVTLDSSLARTIIRHRSQRIAGVTLATSPVVVGGGRGVGSAEAFAPLEELAKLLGGVVGCSRAVTNNGWRNHTDQVGQTGTRIAPEVYFACGISGAIQHWVGAMASKNIIAINTDPQANMVSKAAYAVIGDLHQVVPAISAEIRRRRSR